MPSYFNRIGVGFEVRGGTQYERQLNRNAQANLAYGRSLPIREMGTYRTVLRGVNQDLAISGTNFSQFGTTLVRTEQQARTARIGFTQFRKQLSTRELSRYGTEVGRLDHVLGSANRTLRVTNQRLADQGFSRLGLENLTRVSQRHLRELRTIRGGLENAFNSETANNYVRSLDNLEASLRRVSLSTRQLQRFDVPTLGRRGRVDTRRISREFAFPQRAPPRLTQAPRSAARRVNNVLGALDRTAFNPARDVQARINRNQRQISNINKQIQPLEKAASQARTNLQVIRQGTQSALNDLQQQLEIFEQLAAEGDVNAQRRVGSLREQLGFIQRNISIREQELFVAERSLNIARARTTQVRERISLENESLKQNGIQRSIAQDTLNLFKQIAGLAIRNPLIAAGAVTGVGAAGLAGRAALQRGVPRALAAGNELSSNVRRERRRREARTQNIRDTVGRIRGLGTPDFQVRSPRTEGAAFQANRSSQIEAIFGRDATSFGASVAQTILNINSRLRNTPSLVDRARRAVEGFNGIRERRVARGAGIPIPGSRPTRFDRLRNAVPTDIRGRFSRFSGRFSERINRRAEIIRRDRNLDRISQFSRPNAGRGVIPSGALRNIPRQTAPRTRSVTEGQQRFRLDLPGVAANARNRVLSNRARQNLGLANLSNIPRSPSRRFSGNIEGFGIAGNLIRNRRLTDQRRTQRRNQVESIQRAQAEISQQRRRIQEFDAARRLGSIQSRIGSAAPGVGFLSSRRFVPPGGLATVAQASQRRENRLTPPENNLLRNLQGLFNNQQRQISPLTGVTPGTRRELPFGRRGDSVLTRQAAPPRDGLFGGLQRVRGGDFTNLSGRLFSRLGLDRLRTPRTPESAGAFAFGQARNAPITARLGLANEEVRRRQRGPISLTDASAGGALGQRPQFGATPIASLITGAIQNPIQAAFQQRFSLNQAIQNAASPSIREAFQQRFNLGQAIENAASPNLREAFRQRLNLGASGNRRPPENNLARILPGLLSNQPRQIRAGQPAPLTSQRFRIDPSIVQGGAAARDSVSRPLRRRVSALIENARELRREFSEAVVNLQDGIGLARDEFRGGLLENAIQLRVTFNKFLDSAGRDFNTLSSNFRKAGSNIVRPLGVAVQSSARFARNLGTVATDYVRSGRAAREISNRLSQAATAANNLRLVAFRRGVELGQRGITSIRTGFQRINRAASDFRHNIERTRLVFGNIRIATDSISGSLARNLFTGGRDIARRLESARDSLRTPGGLLDSFRSADAQIEKIDNRLRELGRNLAAPQESLRTAQAEFDFLQAKINVNLRELDDKINDLSAEAQILEDRENAIKQIREERIEPVRLDIEFIENQRALAVAEVQQQFLSSLGSDAQQQGIDAIADKYREIRDNIESATKELDKARVAEGRLQTQVESSIDKAVLKQTENARRAAERASVRVRRIEAQINDRGEEGPTTTQRFNRGEAKREEARLNEEFERIRSATVKANPVQSFNLANAASNRATAEVELNKALEEQTKLLGSANFEEYEERLENINNAVNEQIRIRNQQIQVAERDILLNRQGIQVAKERDRENRRLQNFIDDRDQLNRRLEQEKESLDITKEQVKLKETEAARERTLLEIRKQNLNTRIQTGAGAEGVPGAIGDLTRNVQDNLQSRGLTALGERLNQITDETSNAQEQMQNYVGGVNQANSAIMQAALASGDFNNQIADTGDILEEASDRQSRIISGITNTVSEIARNPVESIFSIGRLATRNVLSIAETTTNGVVRLSLGATRIIGKTVLAITNRITQLPGRLLGLIPVIGDGLRGVFDLAHGLFTTLISGIGQFGIRIATGVVGIARNIFSGVYNAGSQVVEGLANIAENALSTALSHATSILQSVVETASDLGQRVAMLYLNAFRGVSSAIADLFRNVADNVISNLRSVFDAVRQIAVESAKLVVKIFRAPFRFVGNLILNPFDTLLGVIRSIGRAITSLILLPLRPIAAILAAPIRALGFVLNAFNFNQAPQTEQSLKNIQKEGRRTTSIFDQASKALQKNISDTARTSAQSLKAYRPVHRESEDFTGGLVKNIRGIDDIFRILSQGADSLTTSVSSLRTSFSNLALGATGALALLGGILAAGKRADSFKGIILAFEKTGIALNELRDASGRTLRDIDAMRAANVALSNTPEIVRKAFATSYEDIRNSGDETLKAFVEQIGTPNANSGIASVMEIARTQAIRTGEGTKFLFESLTSGIKRSSPKLIDNTGLVIRIGRANEAFADAIGKTVKELTAEETQLALLAETIRAGNLALEEIDDTTEGARQKFERFTASLGNVADRFAFGLQPALEGFLNFFNVEVLRRLDDAARVIASGLFVVLDNFRHGISTLFTSLGETTRSFVTNVLNTLGIDIVKTQDRALGALENIFFGAVSVFASLAGTIAGIWEVITGTIEGALRDIGRMLIGKSPPPEGPLKDIDKGAAAIAEAWQLGFVGVGIGRFESYAENIASIVNNAFNLTGIPRPGDFLGDIVAEAEARFGHLDLEGVEARLADLDMAIEPFEARLGVIREHFDAIQSAAQHSLDAINRQIDDRLQDVIDGSEAAAAQVRQLDELHGRIQRGVALDRAPIDQAEISVGLIRAQQAEERALLGIIQSRLQAEEKARDESEQDTVQDPTNFDFDNTDGDGLDVYLLPGTEELAERARDAFDRAFENARRFITGDQPPNDIAGFINENELNVFERFFNSIPRAIDKLPDNVRAFFTDVNAKIVEILDSPQVVNFESFIESAFGIDVDFSQGYTNLKALLRETLPNKITEYLQNNPRTTAQVNSFVATLFGLENFDIVSFFNENDGFLSIFAIPRAIQNRWIQAVTDAEAEAGQEGENASVPFVQRLVAAFFDVDGGYTIDIPKAAGITWEYLTSPDSIPGSTLRGDLVSLWNDGKLITDALSSVGNVVGGVLNATANLVGMAIHFILGALPTADITSTEADDPFSGLLLSAILNSIFGIAILPAKALSYVVTTPVEEITLEGLVLHILGLTSENVQALFGAGNEFFNKIVPDAIRDAFGDNNLILQLYEVGNDFRQRIHEALFGQPLIGTPSREIVGGTGRGSISDAQRQAASQALQFANQQGISIQATQTLIENARTRAANEFRRNAGQDQFDFDIGQGVGRGAIDSPGIVGNIIRTIQSIPDGIEAFLSAHPNLFNLDRILQATTGNNELTLLGIFQGVREEASAFASNPGQYIGDISESIEDGLLEWANDKNNGLVKAIDSFGAFITGNEDFDIANVIVNSFDIVRNFGRYIREAFGILDAPSGFYSQSDIIEVGDRQSESVLGAFINVFNDLRQNLESYLTNPENSGQFSFIDSVLSFIFGEGTTLASAITGANDKIDAFLGGEGEFGEIPEQTQQFLNAISTHIFGVKYDEVGTKIGSLIFEAPGRIFDYLENTKIENRSLDGFLQATFDNPDLMAEDIIPNILTTLRTLPSVIANALAQTDDFGETIGYNIEYEPLFRVSDGSRIVGDAGAEISRSILGNENVEQIGQVISGVEERRGFTLVPFLTRVFDGLRDSAIDFFDNNPIGNTLTGFVGWLSGIDDFTAQGFSDWLTEFTSADQSGRNQLVLEALQNNPNLFGLDSMIQFFTGDGDATLASIFEANVNEEGGFGSGLQRTLQRLLDSITGRGSVYVAGVGDVEFFGPNIFQRLATKITESFQSVFNDIRTFFADREAEGNNFLGLDNLVSALSGGEYTTVSQWLESFTGNVNDADLEPVNSFPDLIDRIFTSIVNLFTSDVEGAGEVGKTSPIADLLQRLGDQFNSEYPGSLAQRINEFGETMSNLFEVTLPAAISVFEASINAVIALLSVIDRIPGVDLGEGFNNFLIGREAGSRISEFLENRGQVEGGALVHFFSRDPDLGNIDLTKSSDAQKYFQTIAQFVGNDAYNLLIQQYQGVELSSEQQELLNEAYKSGVLNNFRPSSQLDQAAYDTLIDNFNLPDGAISTIRTGVLDSVLRRLTSPQEFNVSTGAISPDTFIRQGLGGAELPPSSITDTAQPISPQVFQFIQSLIPRIPSSEGELLDIANQIVSGQSDDIDAFFKIYQSAWTYQIRNAAANDLDLNNLTLVPGAEGATGPIENIDFWREVLPNIPSENSKALLLASQIITGQSDDIATFMQFYRQQLDSEIAKQANLALDDGGPILLGGLGFRGGTIDQPQVSGGGFQAVLSSLGFNVEQAALDGEAIGRSYKDALFLEINTPLEDTDLNALISTIKPAGSPPAEGPLAEIDEWGKSIGQAWVDGFAATFEAYFGSSESPSGEEGSEEADGVAGAWGKILESAYNSSVSFAQLLPTAFASIPNALWEVFGGPTVRMFNHILEKFGDTLGALARAQNAAFSSGLIVPFIDEGAISGITPGSIDTSRPGFIPLPGAATGGTFGPGGLIVGEEGPELIVPSQRISVFPTQATNRLQSLSNILENSGYQTPIYNNYHNEYNTYDNSQDDHSSTVIVDGRGQSDDNLAMEIKRYIMTRRS